jgi:ribose 1,5-bisphosphokinase
MKGRLFIVVGPSGADPNLHWARRVITRPESAGGEPFEGVDSPTFDARLQAGDFALHWHAHGLRYGIPHSELAQPGDVMVNGSRAALPAIQTIFPDMVVIRICAPSAVLAERLAARGRESLQDITERLQRASYDLPAGLPVIDVINDSTPQIGVQRLLAAIHPVSA